MLYTFSFLLFYLADIMVTAYFMAALYIETRRVRADVSFRGMLRLLTDEFKRLKKGKVAFLHLSIFVGVGLSILFMLIYPLVYSNMLLEGAILALSVILSIGLLAAAVWRVQILFQSRKVHKELGKELMIDDNFKRKSLLFQTILVVVILLTMVDLDLSSLHYQGFFYYASFVFVIRTALVALLYVKPAINTYVNMEMKIPEITTPFNINDVLQGKVDPSSIKVGVETFSDFQKYELNSLDACVEIGACEAACPATKVFRPLSPRVLIRKLAIASEKKVNLPLQSVIAEEELWSCTTCAACVYSCPVDVKHLPIIIDMRRKLVEQGKLDKKKSSLLLSLGEYGNTFSSTNQLRNSWLRETGIKIASESQNFEYLFWVGCMGSFDSRIRRYVSAFAEVAKKAGIIEKIAILGEEETCCGDPARRLGEEGKFQELALANIEKFKKYNVRKILVICPHGLNTFRNEYSKLDDWMKNVEVKHHAQLIDELIKDGRLKTNNGEQKYTIHDPCYLSRYNGMVNPQRNVIGAIGKVAEPDMRGENTFCCGAGGANYWYEAKERKRISHERLEQLEKTNSKNIVTLCPFCNAMLFDAITTVGKADETKLRDIAEIVNDALK